jgi:two-component system nitrogen regulation response regulator NtrX
VSSVLSGQVAPRAAIFDPDDRRGLRERLDAYERAQIEGVLAQTGGNVAEAGRRMKTDRANLYRRMRRLGLRDDEL